MITHHYRPNYVFALVLMLSIPSTWLSSGQTSADKTSDDRAAEILLVRGLTSSFAGDPEAALASLTSASSFAPDNPAILSALADVYGQMENPALELYYAEMASQKSSDPFFHLDYAIRLEEHADRDKALDVYTSLLDRDSSLEAVRLRRAKLLGSMGRHERAAADLELLLQSNADSRHLQGELYESYRLTQDSPSLVALLETMIASEPGEPKYWLLLVHHFVESGDSLRAFRTIERAATENASSTEIQQAYQRLAPARDQQSNLSANERSILFREVTNLRLSEEQFDTILADYPAVLTDKSLSQLVRARQLMFKLRYADASLALEAALAQSVENVEVWNLAATASLYAGKELHALNLCRDGLLIFGSSRPLLEICAYLEYRENLEGDEFAELIEGSDSELARAIGLARNPSEAISYLENAKNTSAFPGLVLDLLGDFSANAGEIEQAVKYWTEAERYFENTEFLRQKISSQPNQ